MTSEEEYESFKVLLQKKGNKLVDWRGSYNIEDSEGKAVSGIVHDDQAGRLIKEFNLEMK